MISRGDAHVFISSIHVIVAELKDAEANRGIEVPNRVYAELSAMETVLARDYLSK